MSTGSTNPFLPTHMMGRPAMDAYFTEEKMLQALKVTELLKPKDVQVIAYNFPSWHPSPFMEERFGKGWTEYDTLQNSRPLFPGHSMPHYPLWGYYDEADPVWTAREIDLAAAYGVDAWMIDWYWHEGTQFYHEQLEQGFLKAPNREKLKFAVMWANHDWRNVYPARSLKDAAMLSIQRHSLEDFADVTNYCAEHYFSQPNYLTIDGAPVFALFDDWKVTSELGEDGLERALDVMRERAQKLGFPNLHLQLSNGWEGRGKGFDSSTSYGTWGWTYGGKPPGSRVPYGIAATEAIAAWESRRKASKIPWHPVCGVGWDDSPRFGEFASIAINRTPDQFERLVRAARHFVASDTGQKIIFIACWNEWTEDQYLLPDTYWGYSYLEALRRAVRD